jgi:hypothetical protein
MPPKDVKGDLGKNQTGYHLLKEYSGKDIVRLVIQNGDGPTHLTLPLKTGYNIELKKRLTAIVGEDNLIVRQI